MAEIKHLKSVASEKVMTYEECLLDHLSQLDQAQKDAIPVSLMINGITNDGVIYSMLQEDSPAAMIGMLDVVRQFLIFEYLGE